MMRKVIVDSSERLQQVGPTSLIELEQLKRRMLARGVDVIDLGRFNPDLPQDVQLQETMQKQIANPDAFRPASASLHTQFCLEVSRWFADRFGVRLNPQRSILPTAGVKEAVHHLSLALVNPGDRVGIPDPSYPLYRAATLLAGGEIQPVPLIRANEFLPNLARMDTVKTRPRLLFLNYPHNPTSRPPDRSFYVELVRWARIHNVIVIQDFAYGEMYYDNEPPISILAIPGARKVAIELHSLSFTYNLAGLKLGFAVGHPEILSLLEQAQMRLTSGLSTFALDTGICAIKAYDRIASANNKMYVERRDAVAAGLDDLDWTYRRPQAGGFFWVPVPRRRNDERLARRLLSRGRVLIAPGTAFGEEGAGYLRISVGASPQHIRAAFQRMAKLWPQKLTAMRKKWGQSDSKE